jgi:hypothetical protein
VEDDVAEAEFNGEQSEQVVADRRQMIVPWCKRLSPDPKKCGAALRCKTGMRHQARTMADNARC